MSAQRALFAFENDLGSPVVWLVNVGHPLTSAATPKDPAKTSPSTMPATTPLRIAGVQRVGRREHREREQAGPEEHEDDEVGNGGEVGPDRGRDEERDDEPHDEERGDDGGHPLEGPSPLGLALGPAAARRGGTALRLGFPLVVERPEGTPWVPGRVIGMESDLRILGDPVPVPALRATPLDELPVHHAGGRNRERYFSLTQPPARGARVRPAPTPSALRRGGPPEGDAHHVPRDGRAPWPTKERSASAIALDTDRELVLFDCGEGTQRQFFQSSASFMRVRRVFISHFHGDHFLGLPGLIQSMSLNHRTEPLDLYGPPDAKEVFDQVLKLGYFTLRFPITLHALSPGESVDLDGYSVRTAEAVHPVPTLAYRLEEGPKRGRFDGAARPALGIRGADFARLEAGESVKVGDDHRSSRGRDGTPASRTGDRLLRGQRAVPGDRETRPPATLLIHEATTGAELEKEANQWGHSARQAAELAKAAEVQELFLTHFSSRYKELEPLETEAKARLRRRPRRARPASTILSASHERGVDLVVTGIGELATLANGAGSTHRGGRQRTRRRIENAALAVRDGGVRGRRHGAAGVDGDVRLRPAAERSSTSTGGAPWCPGFVDAHTHVLYAGDRLGELAQKIGGMSYLEIAEEGGGLFRTVRFRPAAPRRARSFAETAARLRRMARAGTTTAEVKSGYALTHAGELGLLETIPKLARETGLRPRPDVPRRPRRPTRARARTPSATSRRSSNGRSRGCPTSAGEVRGRVLRTGILHALPVRTDPPSPPRPRLGGKIHADEFVYSEGAALAAHLKLRAGGASSDRPRRGPWPARPRRGDGGPAAGHAARRPSRRCTAPGGRWSTPGVPVALGTDLSPNSPVESMPLVVAHAVHSARLTPAEAITAATVNAAHAVGAAERAGSHLRRPPGGFCAVRRSHGRPDRVRIGLFQAPFIVRENTFLRGESDPRFK